MTRQTDEAIAAAERTLADRYRLGGLDDPATLISRRELAHTYRDAGRLDEAIALYEQTLADRQRVLGPDHPDTWRSRTYLADARAKREPRNGAGPPATSS